MSIPTATPTSSDTVLGVQGGVVKRFYKDALGPFVNVKDPAYGAVGDGTTDDTAAIQAAYATGNSVYWPPGVYKITSTITVTAVAQHGQLSIGAGPQSLTGTGSNCTVIRPSAAVTVAFKVDGTGFSSWVQHATFRDMTLDMTNMTDADTTYGFQQIKAWGVTYENVRCINQGTTKRAWRFETGAYTSSLFQCTGNIIDSAGASIADAVTTIQFYGCDIQHVKLRGSACIDFFGCTWQGSQAKLDLDTVRDINVFGGDIEGTGNLLTIGSDVQGVSIYTPSVTGFSGDLCNGGSVVTGITGQYFVSTLSHGTHVFPGFRMRGSTSTFGFYVENTAFTPVIEGTSAAGTGTYTTQTGEYTRVGSMVFFNIRLVWTAHTGTGNMKITGLPLTARNGGVNTPANVSTDSLTYPDTLRALVIANTTRIDLVTEGTGASQAALAMDTAGTLNIAGWYQV